MNSSETCYIYNSIKETSEKYPVSIAILAPERKPLTYRQLVFQIDYTVRILNSMAIGRNDRIATVLPDGPEMAVTFIAITSCATCVPLNPGYSTDEFEFYLSDLNIKSVIIDKKSNSHVIEAAKKLSIPLINLSPVSYKEAGTFELNGTLYSMSEDSEDPVFSGDEDIALIIHTSGTTSKPKIIPLSLSNIFTRASNLKEIFRLNRNDRCLNVMPFFHVSGLIGSLLSSLVSGGSIICTPGFFAPEFFEWMKEFSPTWYFAAPAMHQAILARALENKEIIKEHTLRFIRSTSSPMYAGVIVELERILNTPLIESYGMTEASCITCNPLPPGKRKIGSTGIAGIAEVLIIDERGNSLSSGETGEIIVKGPCVIKSYENNPEASRNSFINGWFRTGDLGFIDVDGYLFITGRIKEIINRGGEKISPVEVDKLLRSHPSVAQAVTFPVAHEKLGEDVASAVVLKDNLSVTETELRKFLSEHLSYFKVPGQIVFINEIPKGPTGKVQRIGLAEKLGIKSDRSKKKEKFVSPETPVEKELEKIWCHVLSMKHIGINDNFLSIGGDSILATKIIGLVRKKMEVELSSFYFFESPTIAGQAKIIEEIILEEIENLPE